MKCFILGILGFIFAAFAFAVIIAQYADYSAEAQMDDWCKELEYKVIEINNLAEKDRQLINVSKTITPHQFEGRKDIDMHMILNDGTILVQGGVKNQLMILTPTVTNTEISWQTFQAPRKSKNRGCSWLPNKVFNVDLHDASRMQSH